MESVFNGLIGQRFLQCALDKRPRGLSLQLLLVSLRRELAGNE
jgi:hypothetical protein